MLQVIVFAYVGQENVYQYVCIVHCHPLRIAQPDNVCRLLAQLLSGEFTYGIGNGLYLRW